MEKTKGYNSPVENRICRDQLVTQGDLIVLKADLLQAIKAMLQSNSPQPAKQWLKSYEVLKLLNISKGTLQTLRKNETLPFTRVGGLIYYDSDEINRLLSRQKK